MPAVARLLYSERCEAVLFLCCQMCEGELGESLGRFCAIPAILLGQVQHLLEG